MWTTVSMLLCVAVLWQGLAYGDPITKPLAADEADLNVLEVGNGANIVLDPDKGSILATLERMQLDQDQLRQDMQQSEARLMALVQSLQEENALLREQQQDMQVMAMEKISDMGKEVRENLHKMGQQVQKQVMELVKMVGEVMNQQAEVMEQAGAMQGVLDVVQEFEDEARKVTSQLAQVKDRLTSAETRISQLEVNINGHASQLTTVQQRLDTMESLLQDLRGGQGTPSPPPSSTSEPTSPLTSTEPITTSLTSTLKPTDTPDVQLLFSIPSDNWSYDNSLITSILVTKREKLIIGNLFADKLDISSLDSPAVVEASYNVHRPWAMLELKDGTIAVTMEDRYEIAIYRVSGSSLQKVRNIPTEEDYFGIAQGPNDTLIVSNRRVTRTARIDVINMQGGKLRTLYEDERDVMIDPFCLKSLGDDVYVSDWTSSRVFRVNVHTGEVKFNIGDLDLSDLQFEQPRKMDFDNNGNLYIATGGSVCNSRYDGYFCVVQITPSGSWRVIRDYVPQSSGTYPYGLEVTSSQIIISWCNWYETWSSELTAYSLPQQQEESTPEAAQKICVHSPKPKGNSGSPALTNVALNKPAIQSTYHPRYGNPEKAVDGSKSTAIAQCTHTADVDHNPIRWWRVDLMGLFEVSAVVITNRGDCCGYRLSDFDIYVVRTLTDPTETQHDPKDLCLHRDEHIEDGATTRLECGHPIVGQYVSLVLRTDSWPLHFCEIEVLGRPASDSISTASTSVSISETTPTTSSSQSTSMSTSTVTGTTEEEVTLDFVPYYD
ncbi:uncharacterized protein LOC143276005 [Babylonia areolata]|uniref:uncharacterized protein LOC143276005 n=1 Tax=Babylonia areolata TaxID=304850 RepID=UPI003FD2A681